MFSDPWDPPIMVSPPRAYNRTGW